ncbi:MAG TPA: glycosyl hydrolase family 28-related protein [Chthoniobacteraceae bacterium]|nr:glycosyl hydrolase family 28-related protein [Chthoniobacteraceae bacterium]
MLHLLFCSFLSLLSIIASVHAREDNRQQRGHAFTSFDVTAYGAKGDGITDDTAAIQRAIQAALKHTQPLNARGGHWGNLRSGFNIRAIAEVTFPEGHYRTTRPIVVTAPLYLRGIGKTVIEQDDSSSDIFYFHGNTHHSVKGLSFVGGKVQLKFWTNNLGPAEISVLNCTFTRSLDYAVECQSYTETLFSGTAHELNHTRPWAPYLVEWEGTRPKLTPNTSGKLSEWFNSTLLVLADSRFIDCAGAVNLQCDDIVLRDCRISGGGRPGQPLLNLPGGMTSIRNLKGSLASTDEDGPYWIEGGGILFGDNLDLDNEGERGVDFIRVSHLSSPVSLSIGGFCINIRNSRVKAAGGKSNALCWLSKGNQPNLLSLVNITETTGRPMQAIRWEAPPGEEALHALLPPNNPPALPTWFRVCLSGNSANISAELPELVATLLEEPVPADALKRSFLPELEWSARTISQKGDRPVINAVNFGLNATTDQETDEVIARVFQEAAKAGDSVVLLPAGLYRLSKTVALPPRVIVKAQGCAIFTASEPDMTLFQGKEVEQVVFEGCVFLGGKEAINLSSAPTIVARVGFEDCSFADQTSTAIRYFSGKKNAGNLGQISVRGGVFATHQALITNASRAQIKESWLINDPRLSDQAFIENHGGTMRLEGNLANPTLWDGKRHKRPVSITQWKHSRDVRWIDNHGSLYLANNRFGGESGGMANVVNYSASGTLYMGGGSTRFHNGLTRHGMINLEEAPELIVLENISSIPVPVDGKVAIAPARPVKAKEGTLFATGVLAPFRERSE